MEPSLSVPEPFKVTELVGSVSVWSGPALAMGTWSAGYGELITVTNTSSSEVAPLLSVTVSLKLYSPAAGTVIVAVGRFVSIIPAVGPPYCVQLYSTMDPSLSVPEPFKLTVLVGSVIVWSGPALA